MKKKLYAGFEDSSDLAELAAEADLSGADGIVLIDLSADDAAHDAFMGKIRACARRVDGRIISGGRVKRLEDVKKYIYAGSDRVFLDASAEGNADLVHEVSARFGKERIGLYLNSPEQVSLLTAGLCQDLSCILVDTDFISPEGFGLPDPFDGEVIFTSSADRTALKACLQNGCCTSVMVMQTPAGRTDFSALKAELKKEGYEVCSLEAAFTWKDVKTDGRGLLPVVVQDYRNMDVLMVAYMNEEAFRRTLECGRMTYWSRSREELWLKGGTSGHFQYVKSLTLDCDRDTLLARVFQVGPACHTGARSCFFNEVVSVPDSDRNPRKVFEDVYGVIADRRVHPKEGSYTNYLFDKGIDKILKKVGEEATEIVIAAKNPDPEEIKYEISDFLYHAMVLMVQRGITWDDITEELSNRESAK